MNALLTKFVATGLLVCSLAMSLWAQTPPNTECINFESFTGGTVFNTANGYEPGSIFLQRQGVTGTVERFQNGNTQSFGQVVIRQAPSTLNPPFTLSQGQSVLTSNATVQFQFPAGTTSVCFHFWAGSGAENIAVNGQPVQLVNFPFNIPSNLAPGVTWNITPASTPGTALATGTMCLTGNIQSLRVGGQEFFLDNLCFTAPVAPCPVWNPQVSAQPCLPNGTFNALFNPGTPTSNVASGYRLFVNGTLLGNYTYAQGAVSVGPFAGDGTTSRTFLIQDNNNPACRDSVVLAPVQCLNTCGISQPQVEVVDCVPGGYAIRVNFAFATPSTVGSFTVQSGNQTYGPFNVSQLPVLIPNVQVPTDALEFEVRVCVQSVISPTPALCCRSVMVPTPRCPIDQCIGFEYVQGTVFGSSQGHQPGHLFYTENGVEMRLLPFQNLDWLTSFLELRVENAPGSPPFAAASGKYIQMRGIGVSFNFSGYPEPVDSVSVDFFNQGGQVNIAANGGQLLILPQLAPGTYQLGQGITMQVLLTANTLQQGKLIFRGNIFSLRIGGSLLRIDNVCILDREPCRITDLRVEALPCVSASGQFFVRLNFQHQGTADSFALYINSNVPTMRAYADLPLTLGPFQSPSATMTFIVADRNDPDCRATATLAPFNCGPQCRISNPEYTDLICNNALSYNLRLRFQHQGTGTTFRVRSSGGWQGVFERQFAYADLPVLLTGIPVPNTGVDTLTICDTQAPDCCVRLVVQVPCRHDCQLTDFQAEALPCITAAGNYMVRLRMNHELTSPWFRLNVNGQYYGTYRYADLPITVGPFPGNGQTAHAFRVQDSLFACVAETALPPVTCVTPPCRVADLQAYLINCSNTNTGGYLYVNFAYASVLPVDVPFDLYINNQLLGTYNLSELPLMLPWPLLTPTLVFTVRVCIQGFPNCCAQVAAQRLPCDASGCLRFEDLPSGAVYGSESGHQSGDIAFTESGVPVRLQRFLATNAASTFGNVRVSTNEFPGFTRAQGQYLVLRNISVQFEFEELEDEVISVCFDYFDGGSIENFSVNGQPIRVVQSLFQLNGQQVAPGVFFHLSPTPSNIATGRACLTGPIRSLLIGGQRFGIDNVCYNTLPPPCRITNATASATPCTDAGYRVTINFQHNRQPDQTFTVRGNGVVYGTFPYSALPITLGPFTAPGTREFSINDVVHPDCSVALTITAPPCGGIIVWPGDADNDNIARHFDLLNIGLAFGFQGPPRANATNNWSGAPAQPWPQVFATSSLNFAYADCDGNGIVNTADVSAIRQNYGQTHGPVAPYVPLPSTPNNPSLFVDMPSAPLQPGTRISAPIVFGRAALPVEAVYGLAFRIEFDPAVFNPDSVGVEFLNNSWLGAGNTGAVVPLLTIDRSFASQGYIEVALTRTNRQNASGFGPIARFHGIIIDDIAGIQSEIRITQIKAIRANETPLAVFNPAEAFEVGDGLHDPGWLDMLRSLQVYPNPTSDEVFIESKYGYQPDALRLFNDKGMEVRSAAVRTNRLSLAGLPSGVYFVKIQIGEHTFHKRVVKQ